MNTIKITPAILPQTYRGIEIPVERVLGVTSAIQIDFVDGHFAPNRTWLFNNKDEERIQQIYDQELGMPYWEDVNYEFDLMVKDPVGQMEQFIALGPSKVILHVESLEQESVVAFFEGLPEIIRSAVAFGVALNLDTDPALLAPYIPFVESVQCMGIRTVGYQGQAFDPAVIEQIKKVRALYPETSIAVDGGVSLDTATALVHAGATELVVGSALFQNTDIHGTMEAFRQVCSSAISPQGN